jgi:amino acid adenylation domain-containing protein
MGSDQTTRGIQEIFEHRADRAPEAEALAHGSSRLTYAALNANANRLAHFLCAHGVGPERRVAICMERGVGMVEAIVATFKAGGAYVPIDPTYPAQRLRDMFDDARPVAVLTDIAGAEALQAALTADGEAPLLLNTARDAAQWAALSADNPDIANGLDDCAYVIYTSGSTGRPKGVEVTHRAVLNLWRGLDATLNLRSMLSSSMPLQSMPLESIPLESMPSQNELSGFAPQLRTALNASLSFDVSVQGWSRLLSGDCVVVVPQAAKLDPVAMLDLLEREHVDLLDCTPSQLIGMVDAGLLARPALATLTVVVAGEAIPPPLWRRMEACATPRFFNAYGPTEATVYATAIAINGAGEPARIGMPLPNVRIEILDSSMLDSSTLDSGMPNSGAGTPSMRVAPGDIGELYIGGAGLARGYLHRPELTAERFIDDPHQLGARLYRTGDLGRWLADGSIEYLGRNDHQVKVRGFRIELGEIEAGIAAISGVRETVALAREDAAGQKQLVAYYRSDDAALAPAAIRAALAAHLPDYMLPAAYVRVETWPQTVNGKLDRAALPPPQANAYIAEAYAPPQTATEHALAAMWSELLDRRDIGANDRFLNLGGDSLRLIQLASRIRRRLERDIPIHSLFKPQTLAQMAMAIDTAPPMTSNDDEADAQQGAFDRWSSPQEGLPARVPLSYQQYGLWLLEQLSSTSIAYNAQNLIRIRGAFDPHCLRRAIERLVQRHEILRTTFHEDAADEPYQTVHSAAPDVFNYRELDAPPDAAELAAIVDTHVHHRFDLAQLPLIRFSLYKLAPQDYLLIQVEQHYVHDGWSMNLILRELFALYDADRRGVEASLPAAVAQYSDYAQWQRSEGAQTRLLKQARYWKNKLHGVSTELPMRTDFPRPSVPSFVGDQVRVVLPTALSRRLREFCREQGLTLFAAMQAVYRMTISHYAGTDDFLIGSAVASRTSQKTEGLVGMFVNMIPARCDLSGDPSYRELVDRVIADLAEDYENQEAPFEWVVRETHPDREYARNPLFQTAFSTHNSTGPQLRWPEFEMRIQEVYGNKTSKFDFDLVMIPRSTDDPDGITMFWEYSVDLYRRETIERLNDSYLRVLAQCIETPERRLSQFDFLAPEERALSIEGGYRAIDVPFALIHLPFETHAAASPDTAAVEAEGATIRYGELNARANRFARYLRTLGVGPDRPVALCMDRTTGAIEAVLAVLKAGGAYLPLDPIQPEARLGFMLGDAQARIVLTDRANRELTHRVVAAMPRITDSEPVRIVEVDADIELWAELSAENLDPAQIGLTPAHLAYIIYTSGSTGAPKGVQVEHRQIAAIAAGWATQYGLKPDLRHLQMASLAFDVFTADLLRALGHGGTLVLCPTETLADPARLAAKLREARIDIADFVPVVLDALVAHLDGQGGDLAGMRTIVCGSDRWSVDAAYRARRVIGDSARLLHAYGLTETAVDSTCYEIAPLPAGVAQPSTLPIGHAVANARVLVLDRDRRPVPVGVVGELYIGGAGVARGYLARPDLDAQRFLDSPFHLGERLYRTGDLGRRLVDGDIEYLGRNDSQVKIRGHRVELGEIEAQLRALFGVKDAVIVVRDEAGSDAALVAYLLLDDAYPAASVESLHDALRKKVPAHMLPSAFVPLLAWPQTANGKLDRAALPLPTPAAFVAAEGYIAPRNPLEDSVAEIWRELLGVERVGVRDDFFRLGGNSLLAMRSIAAIRDVFAVDLSLRRLFDAPTVEGLVEAILDDSMERIEEYV